jgi:hypothetical protein
MPADLGALCDVVTQCILLLVGCAKLGGCGNRGVTVPSGG